MSANLPEMTINGVWTDVYSAMGMAAGTELVLLNKSSSTMYVYVSPTQPLSTSYDGWILSNTFPGNWTTVGSVPLDCKVWVRGSGKILVQIFD